MVPKAKEWRERLFDSLPFDAADTLLVNLPVKIDEKYAERYKLTVEQVAKIQDDVKGNIFVYAAYLKPGKHQIVLYDQTSDTFWAKNIMVEMRTCDIEPQVA